MKKLMFVLALLLTFQVHAAKTLLSPTTDASASSSVTLSCSDNAGTLDHATFIIYAASGHTASEYSDLQISHDGGTTFADVYTDGSQQRLSSTNTVLTVYGCSGIYRVDKEATTNATGVYVSTKESP